MKLVAGILKHMSASVSPAGCLESLVLEELVMSELPPAVTRAAASLTCLRLDVNYCEHFVAPGPKPGSIRGLAALPLLTALRVLEVQRFDLACIPEELSALTALSHICLSWGFQNTPLADLHLLGRLPSVAVLNLQYCQLASLDGGAHGLRLLRTLVASGNPALEIPGTSPWLHQLLRLDLDIVAAVKNMELLPSLVRLGSPTQLGEGL